MFGKKKDKAVKCKIHPSLGEIKYLGIGWEKTEKAKVTLWSKTYDIPLCFIAKTVEEDVNEKQGVTLERFRNVVNEQKNQIEKLIMECFECDNEENSSHRFIPKEILFSQNGECALFARDADEENYNDIGASIAMFLVPKLMLEYPENCLDYILGGGGFFIKQELYGGSDL
ncbi:hypothetical protein CLHUN_40930 [Ruminiclostridium hungatei]|uniref:Uncharacterized protein n=1 Tax=Ruminiclostridium hungatei TaxID=48256 RepID=A0A1V4SDZ0_RUMHU|nr:hypothetical protein [Ruminiclostridium hungatei]OPX42034.1 hypothetical protein CLHUN_40930 [Ruminiclostridium hungatei]